MAVTALYAGLLGPLLVVLAVLVIRERGRARVAIGHGESALLLRRMRVHANFAEYVPLALVLLGLAEGLGTDRRVLHVIGLALLAGRISHAWGVSAERENFRFRVTGMALTFAAIIAGSLACLAAALYRGIAF